jgi:hypothetical protein
MRRSRTAQIVISGSSPGAVGAAVLAGEAGGGSPGVVVLAGVPGVEDALVADGE